MSTLASDQGQGGSGMGEGGWDKCFFFFFFAGIITWHPLVKPNSTPNLRTYLSGSPLWEAGQGGQLT